MSSMQAFRKLLAEKASEADSYLHGLALLARASRTTVQTLKSDLDWTIWWQ